MDAKELQSKLHDAGHLHLFLDSGAEAKISKHDTEVSKGHVIIDSKAGDWKFPVEKVEYADKEPSEVEPRAT